MTTTTRHALIGYGFLLPNLAGFLLFTLGPILFSFVAGFFDWDLFSAPVFVDTANYREMLFSPQSGFWRYTLSSIAFLGIVPVQMAVALATAWLLNENLRGTGVFKTIFFLPVVISIVSSSLVWGFLLDTENGLLNAGLSWFGIGKIPWLYDPVWVIVGVSLLVIWQGSAFGTIVYYAALQGIPAHLYEAAIIDGAGRWRRFRSITLPLLAPTHFFLGITGIIGALQLFAPIYVLTHENPGGAHNLIFEIYWAAYHGFRMGYASALSWVLFLIILILSLAYWRYHRHDTAFA